MDFGAAIILGFLSLVLFKGAAKYIHERGTFEHARKQLSIDKAAVEQKLLWNAQLKDGMAQLAKERQIGFPWLAAAYEELLAIQDKQLPEYLRRKKHPAERAADAVQEEARRRREAEKQYKIAHYLLEYYENIAPFLIELKEELQLEEVQEAELLRDYTEEEREDSVIKYVTKEEYRKMPSVQRNQLALDRFWKRPKSKWLIGRLYERYVGYLYEKDGYDVEYVGIFKGYEDLGRDLICKKGSEFVVIQCKNWSQFRTIYEKHIFQFFGTVFKYKDDNPNQTVKAIFYTATSLSDLARRFATELRIDLKENFPLDMGYPCIKCNVSRVDGTKIYHLPFDQQYDRTKIEPDRDEFFCQTVREAEEKGFRRAFRYHKQEQTA